MSARRRLAVLALCLSAALALLAGSAGAREPFGITAFTGAISGPDGTPLYQAGGHPDLTTSFTFPTETNPEGGYPMPSANVRDIKILFPPGFVGIPTAVRKCSQSDFINDGYTPNCPSDSQIGVTTITTNANGNGSEGVPPIENLAPVYNLVPPPGSAAQFGFSYQGVQVFVDAGLTFAGGAYRIEAEVSRISQILPLSKDVLTIWGDPADPRHDSERFKQPAYETGAVNLTSTPFLSNPTSCSKAPLTISAFVDSWQEPGVFHAAAVDHDPEGRPLLTSGCDRLSFAPTYEARPTTGEADAPTGLDLRIAIPQNASRGGVETANLRDATVVLPEGMAIDPAGAGGLGSCGVAQIELGGNLPATCPGDSSLGTVEIETPLLDHPLLGSVYLARQGENEFGSTLAIYLAFSDPTTGTVLKLAGEVAADPISGRLAIGFTENPQLPFDSLSLKLNGGARAPLVTPPSCGSYSSVAVLAPWSGGPAVSASSGFSLTQGPSGGACPSGAFAPRLEATVGTPLAGSYSPLELRFARPDGSARIGGVSVALPDGFLAELAGIPYCSDGTLAAIPRGEGSGAGQLASPSCPSASKVGSVSVGAGAGTNPFYVNGGSVYLAGPYKGAPLSLAIVVPALAGPFDLGNVVVRTALRVDPDTTQVTAVSDPLPSILDGIPLDLRDVRVKLDRSDFTVQPTSCRPQAFAGSATSTGGASAPLAAPYAPVGCAGLDFAPKLSLSLAGSAKRGGYPRLTAKLRPEAGDANLRAVTVSLPRSEFLAQNHIRTVCTRVQFAADACPASSIYGYAEATTPLLGQPLGGPVYLRSNGGERALPDLVASLHGQIDVDVVGYIDSHKGGIRTRFLSVPDAPLSSFVLRLKGGRQGLLQNSAALCGRPAPAKARVAATGQNGRRSRFAAPLTPACRKRDRKVDQAPARARP